MMWLVVAPFADSEDNGHVYGTGDRYPRSGYEPSTLRVAELSGYSNRIGKPLIVRAEEPLKTEEPPKRGRKRGGARNDDRNLSVSEELV